MPSVDAFQMEVLHRAFRRGFRELTGLIEGVHANDTERSRLIGEHIDFFLVALHHHHAAEDELLWPKLLARVSLHQTEVQRIQDQHRQIAASVDSMERLMTPWKVTAELDLAGELAAEAQKLSHQIDEHLAEEERSVVPLIEQHLTPPEWQAFLELGSSYLSEDNITYGLVLAGMIHQGASPDEWQRFIGGSPIFVQYLWNERGTYTYAKYMSNLHAPPS
jgi:hemerythrin-like domain-containing protein